MPLGGNPHRQAVTLHSRYDVFPRNARGAIRRNHVDAFPRQPVVPNVTFISVDRTVMRNLVYPNGSGKRVLCIRESPSPLARAPAYIAAE